MAEEINYNKFFFAAYSQGAIVMFLISTYFVYTPIVLESLKITETEFALGITVFGITNIIINHASHLNLATNPGQIEHCQHFTKKAYPDSFNKLSKLKTKSDQKKTIKK